MAKINRFILEFEERIDVKIDFEQQKPPKRLIRRFIRFLKKVDDPRLSGMVLYPLPEIVVIAFLAILGGAQTWTEMAMFGQSYKKWLGRFLKLEHGIPSHDTFRRVFSLIKPEQLGEATVEFVMAAIVRLKKLLGIKDKGMNHTSIDGKACRGSARKLETDQAVKNLFLLNVYDNSNGLCLYSQKIDAKTNEIPVAQDILAKMELRNTIVTFDAMHSQKKTAAIICQQKGEYVGGLKGNHASMEEEVRTFFTAEMKDKIRQKGVDYYQTSEKAHNKIEMREFYITRRIGWFAERDQWEGLKAFVCYSKSMEDLVTGKKTKEERYYLASVTDVELCAEAIRGHWGIENRLHWHLDVSFSEDENMTVDKHALANFSQLNKMCLALLELCRPLFKCSIRGMRKQLGWKMEDNFAKILAFLDDDELILALKAKLKKQ